MTINGISSAQTPYPSAATNNKNRNDDFAAILQAVQAGDMSGAQAAFQTFQKDFPNLTNQQNTVTSSSQIGKDMDALQSALNSGDKAAAQTALDSLKQDMKSVHGRGHGHHHHHQDEGTTATSQTTSANSTTSGQQSISSLLDKLV